MLTCVYNIFVTVDIDLTNTLTYYLTKTDSCARLSFGFCPYDSTLASALSDLLWQWSRHTHTPAPPFSKVSPPILRETRTLPLITNVQVGQWERMRGEG